jgi:hypothetical protein
MSESNPTIIVFVILLHGAIPAQADAIAPDGFVRLWNGQDLSGWHGREHHDPTKFAKLSEETRAELLAAWARSIRAHWRVEESQVVNDGAGAYLTTDEEFGDIELRISYRTVARADSGIYLRGTPQIQIWDTTEAGGKWQLGAGKGSGGLWNNEKHERFPLVRADRPFGEWNDLRVLQLGATTTVFLNDQLVVDGVTMENYWDREKPLPAVGPIQLQTHGGEIRFRDAFVRRIGPVESNRLLDNHDDDGFETVFNGKDLDGWSGSVDSYRVEAGTIRCREGAGGTLYTTEEFADFAVRLEFKLPPAGNNGLAIRYPGEGDTAYTGLELQVLDDSAEQYSRLKPWQYHGSVYGLVPSHRGYLRPTGAWNFQEVVVVGSRVVVTLNGTTILDADLDAIVDPPSGRSHPGKSRRRGHFGFAGHNDPVAFRNIRIKRL